MATNQNSKIDWFLSEISAIEHFVPSRVLLILSLSEDGSLTVVGETLFVYLNEGKQQKKMHKIRKFSTDNFSLHQAREE